MHGSAVLASGLFAALRPELERTSCEIALCPPFPLIPVVCETVQGSRILVGAQNVHTQTSGAFTGEVPATILQKMQSSRDFTRSSLPRRRRPCWGGSLLGPLDDRAHEQRPGDGGVGVDLGKAAALGLGDELAPRHAFTGLARPESERRPYSVERVAMPRACSTRCRSDRYLASPTYP